MKKRFALLLGLILLFLPACQIMGGTGKNIELPRKGYDMETELRALWVAYYEYPDPTGLNRAEYLVKADNLFNAAEKMGFNTVFLHVRAFADAYYKSELFPFAGYFTDEAGKPVDFDPLDVMLEAAGRHGIQVDAWVNPFRISDGTDTDALPENSPARRMYENGNAENAVFIAENGIYFNPASPAAQKLVLDGMREILKNYEVGGIHIDDYFYPTEEKEIDALQYDAYVKAGGQSTLADWRRSTVSAFVASAYQTVKSFGKNKQFTVSPSANIDNNYESLYADVATWLADPGYADTVIPQIYFGFEHPTMPFDEVAAQWAALPRCESVMLLGGLGAYRYDEAESGEWKTESDLLARQIRRLRKEEGYTGYAVFSLSSLTKDNIDLTPAGRELTDLLANG